MIRISAKELLHEYIKKYNLQDLFSEDVLPYAELHQFPKGETVVLAGEPFEYFYILVHGKLNVRTSSEDGKSVILDHILLGDILGDIEYITDCDNINTAAAAEVSRLIAIPRRLLKTKFSDNVSFYKLMCNRMGLKLKHSSQNYSATALYDAKDRLFRYILDLSSKLGSDTIPFSNAAVARHLVISDRHLRRLVAELEETGVLSRGKKTLTILDKAQIQPFHL